MHKTLEAEGRNTPALSPWSDWREPLKWFMQTLAGDGDGFLELRLINPHNRQDVSQMWFKACHPIKCLNAAVELSERFDVFVGMTVRGRQSGKAEDCIRASMLWADLDKGEQLLGRVPAPPSLLQDSGTPGHSHAFWALSEPADLTNPAERAEFLATLKALQRAVGSDSVHDAARVMRVPGTLNWKNADNPRVVAPVDFRP